MITGTADEVLQAEEISNRPAAEVMREIQMCLKKQWYRKHDRIVAALIRKRATRKEPIHERT